MKKWILIVAAMGILAMLGTTVIRAEEGWGSKDEWDQRFDESLPKRMEHFKTKLNLSADQATQMEAAIRDRHAKMMALAEETKTKRQGIWTEADTKINGILTPDQQAKYKEMQEKAKEQIKEHRGKHKGKMKKTEGEKPAK